MLPHIASYSNNKCFYFKDLEAAYVMAPELVKCHDASVQEPSLMIGLKVRGINENINSHKNINCSVPRNHYTLIYTIQEHTTHSFKIFNKKPV